jgi:hypothetical protein
MNQAVSMPKFCGSARHQYANTRATHAGRQATAQSGSGIAVNMNATTKLAKIVQPLRDTIFTAPVLVRLH